MASFEDILDRCIAAMQGQGASVEECLARYPAYRSELEPLLRLAARLQAAQGLMAPAEFRQAAPIRMRNLVATTPRQPSKATRPAPGRSSPFLLRPGRASAVAILSAVLLLVLVTAGGTAYASAVALPGTPLYVVKTSLEGVQLTLRADPVAQTNLRLRFAERRLQEAARLAQRGQEATTGVPLAGYVEQVQALLRLVEDPSLPAETRAALARRIARSLAEHQAWLAGLDLSAGEQWQQAVRTSQEGRSRALALLEEELDVSDGAAPAGAKAPELPPSAGPSATPTPTTPSQPTATATATPSTTATPTATPTQPQPPVRPTLPPAPGRTPLPGVPAQPPQRPTRPTDLPTARPTRPVVRPTDRPGPGVTPPAGTPIVPPIAPPATTPIAPRRTPPPAAPVIPRLTPPAVTPVLPPVTPPAETPVLPPITPPAITPVLPPVTPPAVTPIVPPVTPPAGMPVVPPGGGHRPPGEGPPRLPHP